jgi:transaldolase
MPIAVTSDRLRRLAEECGQSPWLDNLRRDALHSGELRQLIEAGVRGLTSNPTIFQKSIMGSTDYDAQFRQLISTGANVVDAYWEMVLTDIRDAASLFAHTHESTCGLDGFVSVEVDPSLAHDTDGTLRAARALHERIDMPNVMIKIPATQEGIPAIRRMIAEGRSVNVTLIFSLDRYAEVMNAYIDGLVELAADPMRDLSAVSSVASFFISRVDTEIDARLNTVGSDTAMRLRGTAAVSQARLAYELFRSTFSGAQWAGLAARGARVQRPLWASTSTKNPDYPDTLYVDELIGSDSVNTLPEQTIVAFADHGRIRTTVSEDVEVARKRWSSLAAHGVDVDEVAAQLEREGVASFAASFTDLLAALSAKAAQFSVS